MESSSSQGAYIYAEMLPNIRQMVLTVSLPSPATESTRTQIHEDKSHVLVHHMGIATEALLPGRPLTSGPLPVGSNVSAKDLVWRLPLDAAVCAGEVAAEADVPWSADQLRPGPAVTCRGCGALLAAEGAVGQWKDLPSENWAEMMEFWHCHKPDHHGHGHGHGHSNNGLASRGYGAESAFTANKGVGFVDLMTVLLSRDDCQGIAMSSTSTSDPDTSIAESGIATEVMNGSRPRTLDVACSSCRSRLGYFNFRTEAVTLFKWQVVSAASTPAPLPSLSNCLTAALVAAFSQTGSAKSLLLPLDDSSSSSSTDTALYIWVLNRRVRFTSSRVAGRVPAMKVMWRVVSVEEAERILEPVIAREQEVNLPGEAIAVVLEELERSNLMYPAKDRVFQDWRVGLLRSWEGTSS